MIMSSYPPFFCSRCNRGATRVEFMEIIDTMEIFSPAIVTL
jgi:hypothetical protein